MPFFANNKTVRLVFVLLVYEPLSIFLISLMKEIIVINDDSKESLHAAKYAFKLACLYNKNIVLANVSSSRPMLLETLAKSGPKPAAFQMMLTDDDSPESVADHLNCMDPEGYQPGIKTLDASNFDERELIAYINAKKTWMVVQGTAANINFRKSGLRVNMQAILNRIQCPVLLVPVSGSAAALERLVYLADLRYAQIPVINYMAKLRTGRESVILAHACAKGLPELDREFAIDLFSNGLSRNAACRNLYFTQLAGRNFSDIVDKVIHGIQGDMLICSNHSYHFEQLFGGNLTEKFPPYVPVPILVFPF